jgi:hypothetical protein
MTSQPRLKRILRKKDLPQYLGIKKGAIDALIEKGEIAVFAITPGGRAVGAFEDDIAAA